MKKILAASAIFLLASVAACSWCVWELARPGGRSLANIDIGGNRSIRIWSDESHRDFSLPNCVYYEILENREVIVPAMFLGSDRGQRFEFQVVFADNGRLACVWQANRAVKGVPWIIIYDNAVRESWPQVWWCEQRSSPREWEERYFLLQGENPSLRHRAWNEP
ncbi:MAG: hypothetical protein HYX68_22905 [Planctomycetes bacterium]|nr:hypothetical protein [Planctomycetota bacterium]